METVNNHTDSIMVTRVRTIHGRWGMPLAVTIDEVAAAMRRAAAESSGGSQRCAGQCTRSSSANSLRDRRPFVNEEAETFVVMTDMDELRSRYPMATTDRHGNFESCPDWQAVERERHEYYACVDRAWQEADVADDTTPEAGELIVTHLAELCRKAGLPQEACSCCAP